MTVLQGLKKIKHLTRKLTKNQQRMVKWCSHLENEEPLYDWEKMMQSCQDLVTQIAQIRHGIHKTNITKMVELDGKEYTIDELIGLRTTVIPMRINLWKSLRRREKNYHDPKEVNVITHFDHRDRDVKIDSLEDFLDRIDEALDQVNIETELV